MSKPTGNPRGRPPLPLDQRRSARWSMRLTVEEKYLLEDKLAEIRNTRRPDEPKHDNK